MSDLSPEELEALINGYVGSEDDESSDTTSGDDVDALDTQEPSSEVSIEESASIDDMLAGIDGIIDDGPEQSEESTDTQEVAVDNFDDILSGIDGVVDNASSNNTQEKEDDDSIDSKIDKGIYPMPVEKEHKVVSQLSQVAEDSEAKASQIFDVLSFILDENDGIGKNVAPAVSFLDEQMVLLEKLSQKFPNVEVFSENLLKAQDAKSNLENINNTINGENDKLFEAMELMQFHDINRQKIERVMAVIRKLSNYLNGLFEDDNQKPEVQIAKHISGDDSETVTADDLDDLISQYSAES